MYYLCLAQNGGKILVNCFVGSSRSATVVVAYLIMCRWGRNIYNLKYTTIIRGLTLEEALVTIKNKRDIKPNPGFLEQLIKLEADLKDKR